MTSNQVQRMQEENARLGLATGAGQTTGRSTRHGNVAQPAPVVSQTRPSSPSLIDFGIPNPPAGGSSQASSSRPPPLNNGLSEQAPSRTYRSASVEDEEDSDWDQFMQSTNSRPQPTTTSRTSIIFTSTWGGRTSAAAKWPTAK
ncbi:hypothetical protein BDZ45DRAFT_488133 [Acephala macrosclerotiorum]|nr:hypothetical protein BDZ45DRAFT_488133 [Acephala macrosclerotiorum]